MFQDLPKQSHKLGTQCSKPRHVSMSKITLSVLSWLTVQVIWSQEGRPTHGGAKLTGYLKEPGKPEKMGRLERLNIMRANVCALGTKRIISRRGGREVWWFEWDVSHSLGHMNIWLPVGHTVWGGLGGVAFLGEVCHWGWLWEFKD